MTGESFKKRHRVYLGLGSNLGDRVANLRLARRELGSHPQIRINRASSIYESEPVGFLDQGWFLNQVVEIETSLDPDDLLHVLQEIENRLGRKREIRWGPRLIDLDILLFENCSLTGPGLTVPHPRMYERNFVLVPLNEIAPDLLHPDGRSTREHLEEHLKKAPGEKIRLLHGNYL
ncbi:MAG: 2-amino-4-hydroxy-6-hydroxymethyldihydropteridine diphosphokinase [Bacillota bacterium]|nr:2-amino-4-hydroxy-6-hydroxymethyldihydropteridine diphosphokinase [Bacillota bacterium]